MLDEIWICVTIFFWILCACVVFSLVTILLMVTGHAYTEYKRKKVKRVEKYGKY